MKIKQLFSLCLMLWALCPLQAQQNVLFIGNSLTYFADMPLIFQQIANQKGKNCVADSYTVGSTGLITHAQTDALYDKIRSRVWDAVVLQPGTSESLGNNYASLMAACKRIGDSVQKKSPCAQKYIYQIAYGVQDKNSYNIYNMVQNMVKTNADNMARDLDYQIVPAGMAFKKYYASKQDLLLNAAYGDIHPSPIGSYLVACSMYAAIYQDANSRHAYYNGIDNDIAKAMQDIADEVVLTDKNQWRINAKNLHADFSVSHLGNYRYKFTNLSSNSNRVLWDFANGQTSTENNPELQFDAPLQSLVFTAYNANCSQQKRREFASLGLKNLALTADLSFYPNPVTQNLFLDAKGLKVADFGVFDMNGNLLIQQKINGQASTIDLSILAPATYLLKIGNKSYPIIKK